MIKITAIPFLLLLTLTALGQSISQSLQTYFLEVRAAGDPAIPALILQKQNANAVITAIPKYYSDTVKAVRAKAYGITAIVGRNSQALQIRMLAAQQLINAAKDPDTGNVGVLLDYLKEFNKSDFSSAAQDSLLNLFRRKTAHYTKLIKLLGFLEINKLTNDLQALAQPGNPKQERWAALLALARMGDDNATQNILSRVKKVGVNDDVVYEIFPDLAYTRQPEAIAYLVEALNSDEKNCESADAEHGGKITCAYRVMEMLAPIIKGFPLKTDASGDIDTKDYPAALQTARKWLKENNNYTILKDRY